MQLQQLCYPQGRTITWDTMASSNRNHTTSCSAAPRLSWPRIQVLCPGTACMVRSLTGPSKYPVTGGELWAPGLEASTFGRNATP